MADSVIPIVSRFARVAPGPIVRPDLCRLTATDGLASAIITANAIHALIALRSLATNSGEACVNAVHAWAALTIACPRLTVHAWTAQMNVAAHLAINDDARIAYNGWSHSRRHFVAYDRLTEMDGLTIRPNMPTDGLADGAVTGCRHDCSLIIAHRLDFALDFT